MKKLILFFLGFITLESQCMSKLGRRLAKINPRSAARALSLAAQRRASNKFFVPPLGKNKGCSGNQLKFPNCTFGYPNSCSFWPCVSCPRLEVPPERE